MASSMYSQRYQADGPPPYHPCALKQWASRVISFSSEYNHTSWSAAMVLGEPKVYPRHGDIVGAWATSICDANQFIEVEFEVPVRPTSIHIYETFNPGAVVKIKAKEPNGQWMVMWQTDTPTRLRESRIFSPPLSDAVRISKINQVRINIDCTKASNWCELDAIQLVGVRDGAVAPVNEVQYFDDMKLLLNSKLHSDVKFNIDGKKVYGHRAIMATRSPYFAKMFNKNDAENQITLKLPLLSYDDLIAVLHFLYTNRLPSDCPLDRLARLCNNASSFEVPELKTAAMYKMVEGLTCANVVSVFQEVQSNSAMDDVKSLCVTFMASHLKDMSNHPSFETLPPSVIVNVVQEATMSLCLNDESRT